MLVLPNLFSGSNYVSPVAIPSLRGRHTQLVTSSCHDNIELIMTEDGTVRPDPSSFRRLRKQIQAVDCHKYED